MIEDFDLHYFLLVTVTGIFKWSLEFKNHSPDKYNSNNQLCGDIYTTTTVKSENKSLIGNSEQSNDFTQRSKPSKTFHNRFEIPGFWILPSIIFMDVIACRNNH